MISIDKITEIFCSIDDFTLIFKKSIEKSLISSGNKTKTLSKLQTLTKFNLYFLQENYTSNSYFTTSTQPPLERTK